MVGAKVNILKSYALFFNIYLKFFMMCLLNFTSISFPKYYFVLITSQKLSTLILEGPSQCSIDKTVESYNNRR